VIALRLSCLLCLAAACSKEPTHPPVDPSPTPQPSTAAARDPEPADAEPPPADPTPAEPAPAEPSPPSSAPPPPTPAPEDCAAVISAANADVVREVLARHGYSRDFAEDHTSIKAGELAPGSDSVDTMRYSACVDDRRCINVSTTTTGDPRYPNRCVKGYDHLYGHDALGIGRSDLTVMVISTEDDVTEEELRAQQTQILDELIVAISP